MQGRQKYGGWACSDSVHMFFYVHQSYRHDSAHPSLLMSWVQLGQVVVHTLPKGVSGLSGSSRIRALDV